MAEQPPAGNEESTSTNEETGMSNIGGEALQVFSTGE
jgi:hypothetical protein